MKMPVETDVKMGQLSALQRFKLIGVLNALPEAQFNQVVLALNPPSGLVAPRGTSKGDRTFDLFAWLESPSGPGLEILIAILKEIPNSDIEQFVSSTSPRYKVTLDVDADNMDVNQLKQLICGIGAVIGDNSIRIIKVDRGSLKLDITGDPERLRNLQELFDSGELTAIAGIPITSVESVDSSTVSQQMALEKVDFSKLIQQLSQLIEDSLQSAPVTASVKQLVERLQQDKQIKQKVFQLTTASSSSLGFQSFADTGSTANIGIHLHDFDSKKLEQVLKLFFKSSQIRRDSNNLPQGVVEFVGRDAELEQLHTQLQRSESVTILAITGVGGVGKSALAIQYAKTFKMAYPAGICWLQACEKDIGTQIVYYAREILGLEIPNDLESMDPVVQVRYCWDRWPEGDALIVLDGVTNFGNYSNLRRYLPLARTLESPRFKILLTTRLKFSEAPIQILPLSVLMPEKSLELLEFLVGKKRVEAELSAAKSLCEWLGHLPLGLRLAGGFLRVKQDDSISEVVLKLQQQAKRKRDLEDEALETESDTLILSLKRRLEAAFELSLELVK